MERLYTKFSPSPPLSPSIWQGNARPWQKSCVECLLAGSFSPDGLNDFITINDRDHGAPWRLARCSGTAAHPSLLSVSPLSLHSPLTHSLLPSVSLADCPLHVPCIALYSTFSFHPSILSSLSTLWVVCQRQEVERLVVKVMDYGCGQTVGCGLDARVQCQAI